MRSQLPDAQDRQMEKMGFLERCLHCLHVVAERIEVGGDPRPHTHALASDTAASYVL